MELWRIGALYQTLLEEDLAPWTETEIRACLKAGDTFDSRRIDYILNKGKVSTPTLTHSTAAAGAGTPTKHADYPRSEQPEAE